MDRAQLLELRLALSMNKAHRNSERALAVVLGATRQNTGDVHGIQKRHVCAASEYSSLAVRLSNKTEG